MLTRLKFILLLAGFKMCCITGLLADCSGDPIHLTFNMDSCSAVGAAETADYSEFVPIITESTGVRLTMVSNSLYRINPNQNRHSCTPGRNGTPAICVSAYDFCSYQPGSYPTVRFDVMVTPLTDESARISNFSFWQKAPEMFEWIDGASGPNNYPTLYGVRILRNGMVVYEESSISTTRDWSMSNYDFSEDDNFKVDVATNFTFELLAYCPVGIFSGYHVWDLEDIRVDAICEPTCDDLVDGATVTTIDGEDNISLCDDNAIVQVTNTSTTSPFNYIYILTDANGMVINAHRAISSTGISFQMIPAGTYYIYGASLTTGKMPVVGGNINDIVEGECESLSTNFITVDRMLVMAGTLTGGPFDFCNGDGQADIIQDSDITITGAMGESMQWVITDVTGTTILHLPNSLSEINFENLGIEDCLIWVLNYSGMLEQIEVGGLFSCITGCMKRSNFIPVNKVNNIGGTVTGGPISLCVGDDVPDHIDAGALTLSGNTGSSTWVVTDALGNIAAIATDYSSIDFATLGGGNYQLWHLGYDNNTTGLEVNNNISNLDGCYNFSNPVTVQQEIVSGGTLDGGPFTFCVGDGVADYLPAGSVNLSGNIGTYNQWVVTDVTGGNILYLPASPYEVDFDQVGAGTCDLWNISYNHPIEGLEVGGGFPTLRGCLGKSNFIEITRYNNSASSLTAATIEFCVGDGEADIIAEGAITLTPGTGANELWVITDANDVIISIPPSYAGYDFDPGVDGNYKIYHLTYDGALEGLMGGTNITDMGGCYSLSTPVFARMVLQTLSLIWY